MSGYGIPVFPPILPPVFHPGTPENDAFVKDIFRIIDWVDGPDDPTDPRQWLDWPKEHDRKVYDDTCGETRTPWQGPGQQFDPNEPPEGPWWKNSYIQWVE